MPKVLISDKLSEAAVQIFKDNGVEVDFQPDLGKDPAKLAEIIGNYDGLAIRSATKVTAEIIEKASNLKAIGRAGIGVDNVDIPAATAKFMGTEITNKTLGLVGAGNIGSIVASRAQGLKMKVIAFDPFLGAEKAKSLGIEKYDDIEEMLGKADFVSLHLPKTEKTANILSAERIAAMKPGARLVNCARGGLVDEEALAEALKSGHVAGAAFDVFAAEPANENPLFNLPNVVCTPHLGAATSEAQENVALQVAEQMSDYLMKGAISNALNAPSVTAEEAPILKPWISLAEVLGGFAGQVTETAIKEIEIEFVGDVGELNLKPLTSALTASMMKPLVGEGGVNMVSAPVIARDRGMQITETRKDRQGAFGSYIRLNVTTEGQSRSVAGTIYSDGRPRIIQIKGINLEAEPQKYMIYTTNDDSPGFIGTVGTKLGGLGVNIATFALGRSEKGGDAIALWGVDEPVADSTLQEIEDLPQVEQVKFLEF